MANRTTSKKRKLFHKRSNAAKKGWVNRRKRQAAESKRRSRAAKKGWRRRNAKAKIKRLARRLPRAKKGVLREFLVSWSYHPLKGRPRLVDFMVIARSGPDAELFVIKAAAKGEDSNSADLTWLEKIPWDEVTHIAMPEYENGLTKKEIKAFGEGWAEVR